jgi:hypothetical protein
MRHIPRRQGVTRDSVRPRRPQADSARVCSVTCSWFDIHLAPLARPVCGRRSAAGAPFAIVDRSLGRSVGRRNGALDWLVACWPGNGRELVQAIERAAVVVHKSVLEPTAPVLCFLARRERVAARSVGGGARPAPGDLGPTRTRWPAGVAWCSGLTRFSTCSTASKTLLRDGAVAWQIHQPVCRNLHDQRR